MTNNTIELSPEIVEQLREVYGNLVDGIGMHKIGDDTYEVSVMFYKIFRIYKPDEKMCNCATMDASYELCNMIERQVLERKPNITFPHNQCIPNVTFHISRNVPDGMVYISPRTYYEMVGDVLTDKRRP